MSRLYLLTGVVFSATYSASICGELCTDIAFTLVKKDGYTASADSVLGNSTVPQRAECIVLCLQDISCVSVEYTHSSGHCLTHDIKVNQIGTTYEQGTDIYKITENRLLPCEDKGYTFSSLGDLCYNVYTKKSEESWDVARSICQSKGGDLVKLDTERKKDAMAQVIDDKNYYIGAKDVYQNGTWRWVMDNSTVNDFSYTDNKGKKICLLIKIKKNGWEYTASKCNKERFICEIVLN